MFDKNLGRAKSSTDLAVKAIPVLPTMLGSGQPRHYFVAFMTPAESRGLGGIVGAYGELTAENGHISLTRSGDDASLDDALPPNGGVLTGLSDFTARYGQFNPGTFFQDVTFSPDLPTVSKVISQLYPQAGGDRLDGVLVVDPYGLAPLLSITGPISVPGLPQPLTAKNAASILLKGQYLTQSVTSTASQAARHDLLQEALHLTFQRLTDGTLPAPQVLSRVLEPAVLAGRIGLWSAHPDEGPLLAALHLDDAFPKAKGGDLVAVSAQNAGANKLDAYLHQSTTDHVLVNPSTGAVKATVTVSLHNDAPASGLPPIVIDNPDAPGTPPGANYDWLSVYSPLAVTHVTLDGKSATLAVGRELGVNVYSLWVLVPSEKTATLTLSLAGTTRPGSTYVLHLRQQPAANPVVFQATVTATEGHGSRGPPLRWTAGPGVDQTHVFRDR